MRRFRGFTLLEVMLASAAMIGVGAAVCSLMAAAGRSYRRSTARGEVAIQVSQSLQWVARDLQQAKDVVVVAPHHLRILYPARNADGTFNRSQTDTVNTIEYFRATSAGAVSATGSFLLRREGAAGGRRLCRNVTNLSFTSDGNGSVTASASASSPYGTSFAMTQRAMFMRNN